MPILNFQVRPSFEGEGSEVDFPPLRYIFEKILKLKVLHTYIFKNLLHNCGRKKWALKGTGPENSTYSK